MFAGETIRTPPPGAWFSTGIIDCGAAGVERADHGDDALVLRVRLRVLAALARVPLAGLGGRVVAVLVARRCSRPPSSPARRAAAGSRRPSASSAGASRPAAGRSDAIRTSGSPSPLYSSARQDEEGSAVTSPPPLVLGRAAVPPLESSSSSPPQLDAASASAASRRTRNARNRLPSTVLLLRVAVFRSFRHSPPGGSLPVAGLEVSAQGAARRKHEPTSPTMPKVGIEPTRPEGHRILSPARLPVPPLRPRIADDRGDASRGSHRRGRLPRPERGHPRGRRAAR